MTGEVTLKWNVNKDLVAQRRAKDLIEFYNWNDLLLFCSSKSLFSRFLNTRYYNSLTKMTTSRLPNNYKICETMLRVIALAISIVALYYLVQLSVNWSDRGKTFTLALICVSLFACSLKAYTYVVQPGFICYCDRHL